MEQEPINFKEEEVNNEMQPQESKNVPFSSNEKVYHTDDDIILMIL